MPIGELHHSELGRVLVTVRQNSRHVSARWKGGLVSLNVPLGVALPDIRRILDDLAPRLMSTRPEIVYRPCQELTFPFVDFVIRTQSFLPDKILATPSVPVSSIEVGTNFNFDSEIATRAISDMLCKTARRVAPRVLVPHARELAARIGKQPTGWSISTGHRILGQCDSQGVISLSYVLVFLPLELCDYVIYHELTHLSEMNHSAHFHELLNGYLDGREEVLVKALRGYKWPVFRK